MARRRKNKSHAEDQATGVILMVSSVVGVRIASGAWWDGWVLAAMTVFIFGLGLAVFMSATKKKAAERGCLG